MAAKGRLSSRILEQVFNHPLPGIERRQIIQSQGLDSHLDLLGFRDAQTPVLLAQVVVRRIDQHALGDEPHNFTARHPHAPGDGPLTGGIEGLVHRGDADVGQVQ